LANIRSQIKRNRQNEQARLRNKSVRSALKTHAREAAAAALRRATRAYDKAVSKGVIHKNNAANHKARLARSLSRGE
jgi:small subunit ribosomal protein S20